MNSNGSYTICNLDNNTYTTHYNPDLNTSSSGGHGPSHHGAPGSHGPSSYGYPDYDQYPYGAGGGGGGASNGCHSGMELGSSLAYDPSNSVITHTQHAAQAPGHYAAMHPGHCGPGQGQYHPYYGGLVNGDLAGQLPNSPGYPPAGYPDSYSPGMMGQHPCTAPGYPPHMGGSASGQHGSSPEQGPVTTYKWMTVKRSQPKTGTDRLCK